ncbi:MAG: hypothetical protein SGPRY_005671, partial [Prymnesium sp.]
LSALVWLPEPQLHSLPPAPSGCLAIVAAFKDSSGLLGIAFAVMIFALSFDSCRLSLLVIACRPPPPPLPCLAFMLAVISQVCP